MLAEFNRYFRPVGLWSEKLDAETFAEFVGWVEPRETHHTKRNNKEWAIADAGHYSDTSRLPIRPSMQSDKCPPLQRLGASNSLGLL
jgi:hypothetical protein